MARFATVLVLLCAMALVPAALADCEDERKVLMAKYLGSSCEKILEQTMAATNKSSCPNKNYYVDCFGLFEDSWTDWFDDCEDAFDKSACLQSYGDDEFERLIKNDCSRKRRDAMKKYDEGAECYTALTYAVYGAEGQCPNKTVLHSCFKDKEDFWTDLVDDCEDLWEDSSCEFLAELSDDDFEEWVKSNDAGKLATFGAAAFAAVGIAMLLLA